MTACPPPEHDKVDQRVGAEAVSAVNRDAGRLTRRVEARHDTRLRVVYHLALDIGGDTAHRVVRGRLDRHAFGFRLDAEIHTSEVSNVGQLLVDHVRVEVRHVQQDVVLSVDSATFLDLLMDKSGDHVAGRKVLERGGVPFREGLAVVVPQDATLAAGCFRQQDAELV